MYFSSKILHLKQQLYLQVCKSFKQRDTFCKFLSISVFNKKFSVIKKNGLPKKKQVSDDRFFAAEILYSRFKQFIRQVGLKLPRDIEQCGSELYKQLVRHDEPVSSAEDWISRP